MKLYRSLTSPGRRRDPITYTIHVIIHTIPIKILIDIQNYTAHAWTKTKVTKMGH